MSKTLFTAIAKDNNGTALIFLPIFEGDPQDVAKFIFGKSILRDIIAKVEIYSGRVFPETAAKNPHRLVGVFDF